tara:strand:+ start:19370 stop:19942 length:573 start_codon:yes stop_codon:yes gene_type:complete
MKRYLILGGSFVALLCLMLAYQNFRVLSPRISSELKQEVSSGDAKMDRVKDFYGQKREWQFRQQRLYHGPKDFVKSSWKESELYEEIKDYDLLEMDSDEAFALDPYANINSPDQDSEAKRRLPSGDMKMRYNPFRSKASIRYEGEWQTAVNLEDQDLELNLRGSLGAGSVIEVRHERNEDKTFVQYLLSW